MKDQRLAQLIAQEHERQHATINLIASENYVSSDILTAVGSCLTNKYAEGLPRKRYYEGCEVVDEVEEVAIERCKELFATPEHAVDHVNVQPHAGSQANMAAYAALLQPGDTIMGMGLNAGGHLTHGHSVSFSGTLYTSVQYAVNPETYLLDYDAIERLAHEHKPKLIIAGASCYPRTIDFQRFARIAHDVGAYFIADIAHIAGLIAADLHPSPIGYADCVTSTTHKTLRGPRGGIIMSKKEFGEKVDRAIMPGLQGGPAMNIIAGKAVAFGEALQPSFKTYQQQIIKNAKALALALIELGYTVLTGGTDNHLFVIDLRPKNITGLEASRLLASVGIITSRSTIPFDTQKPWITSGIRLGTPAITTRGMGMGEMCQIAQLIHEAIMSKNNQASLQKISAAVKTLCDQFPIPG